MHKIVYLPLAESDLMDALGYIAYTLDAPKAARDLLVEFDEMVQRIAEFPYAHELYRTDRPMKDEIRKVAVRNYVLYYAVFQDRVEIRRFLYGRRDRSRIIDMSELTKEQLKSEIEKGFADAAAGRVRPAPDMFTELQEE